MPVEWIVDTNVWVVSDYDLSELDDLSMLECVRNCRIHLNQLRDSDQSVLLVDHDYCVMNEYRNNLSANSLASEILNELEQKGRIVPVVIELDELVERCYAALPDDVNIQLQGFDRSDRKFIALAFARDPYPPIYNAADSDWAEYAEAIAAVGLRIIQLCPDLPPRYATEV